MFNGLQAHNAVKQAQINVLSNEINKEQASLRLKQDVYKAYNEGLSAIQKYQAANRATDAARRAYNFAQKRYELGLTNTVEYLTVQNNQFIAESNLLSAKYDLIFKLKVMKATEAFFPFSSEDNFFGIDRAQFPLETV